MTVKKSKKIGQKEPCWDCKKVEYKGKINKNVII